MDTLIHFLDGKYIRSKFIFDEEDYISWQTSWGFKFVVTVGENIMHGYMWDDADEPINICYINDIYKFVAMLEHDSSLINKSKSVIKLEKVTGVKATRHRGIFLGWHIGGMGNGQVNISAFNNPLKSTDYIKSSNSEDTFEIWYFEEENPRYMQHIDDILINWENRLGNV